RGVEELVAVPTGGQRTGLRLAIADHASNNQIGIVKRRAVGMAQSVAQFSPFVNAARRFRGDVAGDTARKAELFEKSFHALGVLADVGVHLTVSPLEIGMSH